MSYIEREIHILRKYYPCNFISITQWVFPHFSQLIIHITVYSESNVYVLINNMYLCIPVKFSKCCKSYKLLKNVQSYKVAKFPAAQITLGLRYLVICCLLQIQIQITSTLQYILGCDILQNMLRHLGPMSLDQFRAGAVWRKMKDV